MKAVGLALGACAAFVLAAEWLWADCGEQIYREGAMLAALLGVVLLATVVQYAFVRAGRRAWSGALALLAMTFLIYAAAVVHRPVPGAVVADEQLSPFDLLMISIIGGYGLLILGAVGARFFTGWMGLLGLCYLLLVLGLLVANVIYIDLSVFPDSIAEYGFWRGLEVGGKQFMETYFTDDIQYATALSFKTSIITVIVAMIIGIPAGYILSRYNFPGKVIVDTLVDIPIVLPPLVVGVSLLIFFNTPAGRWANEHFAQFQEWVNNGYMGLQSALGIGHPDEVDTGGFVFAIAGIVLAQFTVACAFGIRTVKATFDQIDRRVEDVARTLGATRGQAFFRVALPMARQGIVAAAVMVWARAIGEFGPILIFCGTTRQRTEVLPTSIYLEFSVGNLQAALVISMFMVVLAGLTLLIFKLLGGKYTV